MSNIQVEQLAVEILKSHANLIIIDADNRHVVKTTHEELLRIADHIHDTLGEMYNYNGYNA